MDKNKRLDLSPAKRQQLLLEELKQHKALDVKEAASKFFIAEATVRRDFKKMEQDGLLRRTYGGAVLVEGLDAEIPLFAREGQNIDKKDEICRQAAALVKDGDTLILDSSSTVCRMIRFLRGKQDLKVVTNGAKTALLLAELPGVTIYCTGGKMRENSLSYIGQSTMDYIRNFYADLAFFSCRSLSERGLSDYNEEEALLRRVILESSRRSVLLIDSTKCGTNSFFHICPVDAVDQIITDDPAFRT